MDIKYGIKVCTDPFMVGDGEIGMREKPLSTNCFIKSDNNMNFLTMVQGLSSLPLPRAEKKKILLGKQKKEKKFTRYINKVLSRPLSYR